MASIDELLGRTLVLVAHPDDEVIAFGALLQRIREPVVVFATNGSPQDPYFWQPHGSREAYAALRRQETFDSMQAAGVKDVVFLSELPGGEGLVDQELYRNLGRASDMLCDLVQRVGTVGNGTATTPAFQTPGNEKMYSNSWSR